MYPEQHSPLSWSRRPARPGSPTAWASFQACSSPTGRWATRPRTGLWGRGAWPIRMRNCTVLGDVAWWALRASLVFFPSNIPQPGFLSPSCRSILFWGPWTTNLEGACKSFYTRGIGPAQRAVCCWASLLTSLCFGCHHSKVGTRIAFT